MPWPLRVMHPTAPRVRFLRCSSPSWLKVKLWTAEKGESARVSSSQAIFLAYPFLKFLTNHKNEGLSKTSLGKTFYLLYQGSNQQQNIENKFLHKHLSSTKQHKE